MSNSRIRALAEAVERSPDDVELHVLLAEAQLEAEDYEAAEETYKGALKLAPQRADLTLGLARTLSALGRQDAALTVLSAHAELSEPSPQMQIERARLLLAADRRDEAARCYENAVEADPELADSFLARRVGARRPRQDPHPRGDEGRVREPAFGPDASGEADDQDLVESEKPKITFRDVGGMEKLKEEIRLKIVHPLQNPELYKAYGKAIGGGILLYGPPGCGKTYLARATAGEVDATYMPVGIHDVLDMWIGQSERNLHQIFEQARRTRPSVLFFDEVDALGASRTDMRGAAGRHVINQFLSELDGVTSSNDGVLVLAATNAPWHLDNAFRRPGRFDRVIFVPPPDLEARARILEILCQERPVDAVDYEKLARRTDQYSGADLESLIDMAIEGKLEQAMKDGKPGPLTTKDLLKAAKAVRPTTRDWFATARNYVLYANESGLYDDVRSWLDIR